MSSLEHDSPAPQTIAAIFHHVTVELDRINALGLSDLKTALQTAASQKDGLVKDYRAKFKQFRERWWCEHQLVTKLHQALTCTFERDKWREIARECICRPKRDINERSRIIDEKNNCSKGELERIQARALAERDRAKTARDAWAQAATLIDQQLTANDQLAKSIQTLIGNGDPQAIYKFWFSLLPAHKTLTPYDAPESARELGEGESPDEICGFEPQGHHRAPPWLVDPDKYGYELDESWQSYYAAQLSYSAAAAAFLEHPDDLATITANRDNHKAALDADIASCLKRHAPNGACCTDTPATAAPAATTPAAATPATKATK
jgi:hypothetical protein